jgi:hypothetical protein
MILLSLSHSCFYFGTRVAASMRAHFLYFLLSLASKVLKMSCKRTYSLLLYLAS